MVTAICPACGNSRIDPEGHKEAFARHIAGETTGHEYQEELRAAPCRACCDGDRARAEAFRAMRRRRQAPRDERILCAAIHVVDELAPTSDPLDRPHHLPKNLERGLVFSGLRHHNCISLARAVGVSRAAIGDATQGFLTSQNRFVDREEAMAIARRMGQTDSLRDDLYSEDLY